MTEHQRNAQLALDELFAEGLLPFNLIARRVSSVGPDDYIVQFTDNRLRDIDISWSPGECFKAVLRIAIMERGNSFI